MQHLHFFLKWSFSLWNRKTTHKEKPQRNLTRDDIRRLRWLVVDIHCVYDLKKKNCSKIILFNGALSRCKAIKKCLIFKMFGIENFILNKTFKESLSSSNFSIVKNCGILNGNGYKNSYYQHTVSQMALKIKFSS